MLRAKRYLAAALLLTAALPATAAVTLNLKDAEISTLIATVSEVTGKNFIVDPRVKGKVTVISSKPMNAAGVYETFLAVLQVQGFAAIPAGQAIKIVPEANARTDGGVPNGSGEGLPIDAVTTYVYQIENISASQLVPLLRPLVTQWGHLAAYVPGNMLIISDRAANVQRLEQLIKRMDQSSDREIEVVRLKNAAAGEVVRTVTALTQQDKQTDPGAKPAVAIADERTNSVLIGGDKTERQKLLDIIEKLDVALQQDGNTQVVYLRYASAENLAPILQGYAQQVSQGAKGGATTTAAITPVTTASGGGGFEGIRILADKDTNALVITAPPKTMRQVREVIAQLDIQRAQVLVEAVIAEISANKSSQLGIDWAIFNSGRLASAGIFDPATLQGAASAAVAGKDSALLGLLGQGINIGGGGGGDFKNGTSFAILLKALQGDGDSNVLSTPTLVTLDNQEAKFSAGQEVPFLTGQFTNTAGGTAVAGGVVNPFQTIERKDVGLTLGVTPQINEGNHIKLKLNLEVSSLGSGTAGAANLITNKRTLTNTVGVENGQVLVIGGLIDDQLQDQQRGVPFLSSIPIIGNLFQYRSIDKTKRNLMLFIRPSILRKESDGDYYTRRKYDAVRQAQIGSRRGAVPLIGGQRPVLEKYDDYRQHGLPPVAPADTGAAAAAPVTPAARPAPAPTAPEAPAAAAPTPPAAPTPAPPAGPVTPAPATPAQPETAPPAPESQPL